MVRTVPSTRASVRRLPARALRAAPVVAALAVALGAAAPAAAETTCEMTFRLAGWSAFYKTATGEGSVRCKNGQTAEVSLRVNGGGFTFGNSTFEGKGTFSGVQGISDVFGGYFRVAAEGGPAGAYIYNKGPVHLAVSGSGRGFTLGFDFGNLKITKR